MTKEADFGQARTRALAAIIGQATTCELDIAHLQDGTERTSTAAANTCLAKRTHIDIRGTAKCFVCNRRATMFALSYCRPLARGAWLALGALTCACSFTPMVEPSASACVQGQSQSCPCVDGSLGVRICGADSVYGICQCGAPSSGGTGGVVQPIGGSAGSVAGGAGSDPVVDAGGAGFTGNGGTSGSDDGGVMAGTGGIGGTTGMAGAAGDATGGGPVVEDEPAPGETAYGACRDDGSCDLPMFCVFDALSGGAERYCAAVCTGNGLGELSCPVRPDGSRPFCVRNLCMR